MLNKKSDISLIAELGQAFKNCAPFNLHAEVDVTALRDFSGTWRRVIAALRGNDTAEKKRAEYLLSKIGVTYQQDGRKMTFYHAW